MDPISNMLIQIKNAQAVKKDHVVIPFSEMKYKIAMILKEKGFVSEIERKKNKVKKTERAYLDITLKYEDGLGAFNDIKIISKPSRRMYIKASEIKPVRSGYGTAIISTSKGVMHSEDAKRQKLGGELICEIY